MIDDRRSALLAGGCGVTAWDLDDALELIAAAFAWWSDEPLPAVAQVIREVDVSTLPERAWVHGMGVVVWRGVWSPPMNNYVPPTR
ncbi:MAG: hypothetical protein GY926_11510 [bacterium]|nr:hypothetical protein [bacterium]